MDNKDLQSKLIDYLYDEMEPDERREFEQLLEENPELQKELEEMQTTRHLFEEDTIDISPGKLLLIDTEPQGATGSTSKLIYLKTAAAIAATLLITVLALSFANMQITTDENGTIITFGAPATTQPEPTQPAETEEFLTEDEFYALLAELQTQNNQAVATALERTRQQHQQQLENVIQTLTTYYDQRRAQDLTLVSEGLAQLEEETYFRFLQTEEAFEDLIFALNVQQSEE